MIGRLLSCVARRSFRSSWSSYKSTNKRERGRERKREREFDEAYILHSSWIETREIEIERRGEEKR